MRILSKSEIIISSIMTPSIFKHQFFKERYPPHVLKLIEKEILVDTDISLNMQKSILEFHRQINTILFRKSKKFKMRN